MKLLFTFCFLVLLSGCGRQSLTFPVAINFSGVTQSDQQHITNFLLKQNSLNKKELFQFKQQDTNVIKIQLRGPWSEYPDRVGYAQGYDDHCDIELSSELMDKYTSILDMVVLHELGHCFGLSHSDNSNDIMYPETVPEKKYPTDAITKLWKQVLHK